MKAIETGTVSKGTDYLQRCKKGTLDARLPARRSIEKLIERYWSRKKELVESGGLPVFILEVKLGGKLRYVIADGKHRAAMIAYLDRPDDLILRLLSNSFIRDPFFEHVYSFALSLDPREYSTNQKMIRAIIDES